MDSPSHRHGEEMYSKIPAKNRLFSRLAWAMTPSPPSQPWLNHNLLVMLLQREGGGHARSFNCTIQHHAVESNQNSLVGSSETRDTRAARCLANFNCWRVAVECNAIQEHARPAATPRSASILAETEQVSRTRAKVLVSTEIILLVSPAPSLWLAQCRCFESCAQKAPKSSRMARLPRTIGCNSKTNVCWQLEHLSTCASTRSVTVSCSLCSDPHTNPAT
ncbi:hypothetical protein J3F84DRAFT_93222 [Trichoderma pleuroticola]